MLLSWIVSVPAPPVTVSPLVRPVVVANLKISSPEPPTYLSAVSAPISLTIRNEPLLTAEPSLVVTPAPVLETIASELAPRFSNVSLPNVKVDVLP